MKEIETVEECFKDRPLSRLRERIGDDGEDALEERENEKEKRRDDIECEENKK